MKLVLQIAAGILLAVTVIAVAYFAFTAINSEAAQQNKEAADAVVSKLTPDLLVSRCGKPASDKTERVATLTERTLDYDLGLIAGISHIEITFGLLGDDYTMMTMSVVDFSGRSQIVLRSEQRLADLPCIASGTGYN